MKCRLCNKTIQFKNVDWDGFEHCPECGGVDMDDEAYAKAFAERARKIQFIREVEEFGNDISRMART